MRLIDADKLKADVVSWENCYNGFSDTYDKTMIIDTIDEQPTIDAVPVVRCGECKYWYKNSQTNTGGCSVMLSTGLYAGGFCSYGERRADEGATE
jgi:hypothetical protein